MPGSAQDQRIRPVYPRGTVSDIKGLNLIYYSPRARGWLYTSPVVTSACCSRIAAANAQTRLNGLGRPSRCWPANTHRAVPGRAGGHSVTQAALPGCTAGARSGQRVDCQIRLDKAFLSTALPTKSVHATALCPRPPRPPPRECPGGRVRPARSESGKNSPDQSSSLINRTGAIA